MLSLSNRDTIESRALSLTIEHFYEYDTIAETIERVASRRMERTYAKLFTEFLLAIDFNNEINTTEMARHTTVFLLNSMTTQQETSICIILSMLYNDLISVEDIALISTIKGASENEFTEDVLSCINFGYTIPGRRQLCLAILENTDQNDIDLLAKANASHIIKRVRRYA